MSVLLPSLVKMVHYMVYMFTKGEVCLLGLQGTAMLLQQTYIMWDVAGGWTGQMMNEKSFISS
jgi:hypothetical protein